MIIKKLKYSEFDGMPNAWSLDEFELDPKVNLLVGKNATGKTNTLKRLEWLGTMFTGQQSHLFHSQNYHVIFSDGQDADYHYTLEVKDKKVENESLSLNNEASLFTRNADGTGKIHYAELNSKMVDFKIQHQRTVVEAKRDALQYPFLEPLAQWAENMNVYGFTNMGQNTPLSMDDTLSDLRNCVACFLEGREQFGDAFVAKIIAFMETIGYNLRKIDVTSNPVSLSCANTVIEKGRVLFSVEKESNNAISQYVMSQGMFRALSLLIQLTYNIMSKSSSTILIDDIGEGLDFDRSTNLIHLLIDLAEHNDIQLIMSTNDRYVMNGVDLKYWQVIDRKGGRCRIFNYNNARDKFEDFDYSGLSNFDFLRMDWINSEWKKEK
jgi:predicted ATPase